MKNELLFYMVILLSNIIQGITGFAGTILAMPFSLRLVGYETAVPVLNVLGIISGIYVLLGSYREVDWKELRRIVLIMGSAILLGLFLRQCLSGSTMLLYRILGVVVLAVAARGFYHVFWLEPALAAENEHAADIRGYISRNRNFHETPHEHYISRKRVLMGLTLVLAGLVHGMFVCGGPLLIGYLANRVRTKMAFRATISSVWVFLNGIILVTQLLQGMWTKALLREQLLAVPFLLGGMFIGGILYRRMSQHFFMVLTYILLAVAGLSLFFK